MMLINEQTSQKAEVTNNSNMNRWGMDEENKGMMEGERLRELETWVGVSLTGV